MRVLGIESSCDETAAAVVTDDGLVLSDVVASQFDVHVPYGGVVPELASRAHLSAIVPVVEEALLPLARGFDDVDAIAVTQGPGLVGALFVGMQAAKALAYSLKKPLVGVDHLVGHLLAVHLHREGDAFTAPAYPYVALLASGGHTALYNVKSPFDIEMLGQTRDDAAGEAFDKSAKLLGLGYPGGPLVDKLAANGNPKAIAFPRPMRNQKSLEFSFSGIKTSVAQWVQKNGRPTTEAAIADVCASLQAVIVDTLVQRAVAACESVQGSRLVLAGGVAANRGLRARALEACSRAGIELFVPPMASCTDNAAMIAYTGAQLFRAGKSDDAGMSVYGRRPDVRRGRFV